MLNCILCLDETPENDAVNVNQQQCGGLKLADAITLQFPFVDISYNLEETNRCCKSCALEVDRCRVFFEKIKSRHRALNEDLFTKDEDELVDCFADIKQSESTSLCNKTHSKEENVSAEDSETKISNKGLKRRGRSKKATSTRVSRPRKAQDAIDEILPKKSYRRRTELDEKKILDSIDMKCELCLEKLDSFAHAIIHHRDVHSQKGYLMCCARKFKQRSALIDHLDFHSNPEYFQCKICTKNFTSLSNLRTHITLSHIPQTRYQCDICGKFVNCKYRLTAHLKNHIASDPTAESFPCVETDCGKSFQNRLGLKAHVNVCHNPNRITFPCEICGKQLMSRTSLRDHLKNTHAAEGSDKIPCKICNHWIKNEYSMKKHLNRHKQMEQNITCELCDKKCTTKAALRSHLRMKHLLQRNLQCRFCVKKFKQNIDLNEHEATHTGVDLYSCLWCTATFKFGANFRAHRKNVHPEEYEKIKPAWLRPN